MLHAHYFDLPAERVIGTIDRENEPLAQHFVGRVRRKFKHEHARLDAHLRGICLDHPVALPHRRRRRRRRNLHGEGRARGRGGGHAVLVARKFQESLHLPRTETLERRPEEADVLVCLAQPGLVDGVGAEVGQWYYIVVSCK